MISLFCGPCDTFKLFLGSVSFFPIILFLSPSFQIHLLLSLLFSFFTSVLLKLTRHPLLAFTLSFHYQLICNLCEMYTPFFLSVTSHFCLFTDYFSFCCHHLPSLFTPLRHYLYFPPPLSVPTISLFSSLFKVSSISVGFPI